MDSVRKVLGGFNVHSFRAMKFILSSNPFADLNPLEDFANPLKLSPLSRFRTKARKRGFTWPLCLFGRFWGFRKIPGLGPFKVFLARARLGCYNV
ncbi:MAG TPA: hypothetical protein DCW86_01320 [Actinobacteria bacterium]|nr:hypothetical protein [Actinomycetota bacterium]